MLAGCMLTREEVLQRLREACEKAGSENAWAKAHGMSQAYVNDAIRGRREPGPAILEAMGLEKVIEIRYRPTASSKQPLKR
jgi:hypothetical protein